MKNAIYLRRKNKVIVNRGNNVLPDIYIGSALKNIESLGYTFSEDLIKSLRTLSVSDITAFYTEIVKNIKNMVGASVRYTPMYPNFPAQVMNMDECELYINAIIHYITYGQMLPDYEYKERFPLLDKVKLKVIGLGTEEDFINIFVNIMNAKTSISETDKEDLQWFFKKYRERVIEYLPEEIPLKENAALVSKLLLRYTSCGENVIKGYFKTATDVLRLAVALSDGDMSLAENTRFRSFKRAERRVLLGLLENCGNIEEDMLRYDGQWIRLGERLHPSEYKTSYVKSQTVFYKLRNNIKIETFGGKVAACINNGNYMEAVKLLKTRPGEFARKLDYFLRVCPEQEQVIEEFKDIVMSVSTTVLLQVMEHFRQRNTEREIRVFFPKGIVAKAHAEDNKLPQLSKTVCDMVVEVCEDALVSTFKDRESMGKVYIDERLKNYTVPFSQRSASKSLKTIARGSKIDFPDDMNTIRSFIYWKEPKGNRVDIDLSAVMYDRDWRYKEHISYTNLRSSKYRACHSGDITAAPEGASEFIDIDIGSVRRYGGRYIVISMNSYTTQPYKDLPECFVGWMARQNPNSGEIYEPSTVENKADITSDSIICIPMILDLYENKVIWTDLSLKSNPNWYNNVEGNQGGMVLMGKAMTNLVKPNLYDLFELHAKARGIVCKEIEEADTVFSLNKGTTPYDFDIIISEYL